MFKEDIRFPDGSSYVILITELVKKIFPILFIYHLNNFLKNASKEVRRMSMLQRNKNPLPLKKHTQTLQKNSKNNR